MKIVALTGSGISAESGLTTFRDAGGLWENYSVEEVCTHEAWEATPQKLNQFYNMLRRKAWNAQPCEGHQLLAQLEQQHEVRIVTQNVDNLHERAGSSQILHLHGELFKSCSARDVDDPRYHRLLTAPDLDIAPDARTADGALERPFIVFFGEAVPLLSKAAQWVQEADLLIIIGTSLQVYPAASLIHYAEPQCRIVLIDPAEVHLPDYFRPIEHLCCGASEGMRQLAPTLLQ